MDHKTWGEQVELHPELASTANLRGTIAEVRFGDLLNTVGKDERSRCSLRPFQSRTGRNQPSERGKIFLPALPRWVRGVMQPPPGYGMAELDYTAQELLAMAMASGDEVMLADYLSGDPYVAFGVRAGLIPAGWVGNHPFRGACKIVVLGMLFGMSPYGIAAKTGKSMTWARGIYRRHREVYWKFHQWLGDVIATARLQTGLIVSPLGWPMVVTDNTPERTLMNFPAQSAGGDMLRCAIIMAIRAGILVCAPIHDALVIMAPSAELPDTITRTIDIMAQASAIVTGGVEARVKVAHVWHYPCCLGDVRDVIDDPEQKMWLEVNELLDGGLLRRAA
jgi:DNA polymerase-1